jgi:uncharacterized protein
MVLVMTDRTSPQEIEGQVAQAVDLLDLKVGIDTLWLFGSQARGTANAESDLDLGALFRRRLSGAELLELRAELVERLGRDVDLMDLDRAGPPLAVQVVRHGRLVVDRSPRRRIAFVAGLPGRYQDVALMRAPIERALLARLAHGRA